MKIVISLGGSIFSKEYGVDVDYVKQFSKAILEVSKEHRLFIVTGGGKTARQFINAGREIGADEYILDLIGIQATRLNATVLSASLGKKGLRDVPEKVEEADHAGDRIFVMGGTAPGHTTDAVSAMLADHIGADLLINATNVDGVYERDPKKDPKAKKFRKLSSDALIKIVDTGAYQPGTSAVIDPKAAKIIHEKSIRTIIVDGRNLTNITDAIKGKSVGTLIED